MERIIDSVFRGIGHSIGYIIVKVVFEFVFYFIGWPFVKILSFGKYPKGRKRYGSRYESREGALTSLLGMFISIGLLLYFYVWDKQIPMLNDLKQYLNSLI